MATAARQIGPLQSVLRFFRELREALVQAVTSLFAHKLRAALTIAGIGIGVCVLIAVASALAGMDEAFARQLSQLGPNTLYVSKWAWFSNDNNWWKFRNRPGVGRFDYRALQANANLPLAVSPIVGTQGSVLLGETEMKNVEIRGTTEAFLEAGGSQLKRGRFLSQMDEDLGSDACVIGADLEDAFTTTAGEVLGLQIRVGPTARCTVVGTLVRKGNAFGRSQDNIVLLPLSAFARSLGAKRNMTIAVVAPPDKMKETEEEIIQVLRTARRLQPDQEDNFSVNRQDKILQVFSQTTEKMKLVILLVGAITLVVGGIGIMNIMLVSVKERTREIGVRRALGARRSTILLQFILEAIGVSLAGGLIGTAVGLIAAQLIALVTPLAASAAPSVILGGVAFSACCGLIFGLWPALQAALLHPIEALRYE